MKKKIQYPLRPRLRKEKGIWVVDLIDVQNAWREQAQVYALRNNVAMAWAITANQLQGSTWPLTERSPFANQVCVAPYVRIPPGPSEMLDVLYSLLGRRRLTLNVPKCAYLRSAFDQAMEKADDAWGNPFAREEGRPVVFGILDRATKAGAVRLVGWSNNSLNLGRHDIGRARTFIIYDQMANPQDYR